MKRAFTVIALCALLIFSLIACNKSSTGKDDAVEYKVNFVMDETTIKTVFVKNLDEIVLPDNPQRDKCKFRGWEYNGVLVFDEYKQNIEKVSLKNNMKFTPKFVPVAKITVVKNMEEAGTLSYVKECEYYSYAEITAYSNKGYNFLGWYDFNDATMDYDVFISKEQHYKFAVWTEDINVQAKFEIASFNLKIYSNNVDLGQVSDNNLQLVNESNEQHKYLSQVYVKAFTKTNEYNFLGWYDKNNNRVCETAEYEFTMVNYDYTLEAKWDGFNITYELNGGIQNDNNPTQYQKNDTVTLLSPTKEGYSFIGWECENSIITKIFGVTSKHLILSAKWTPTKYSISYIVNEGGNNAYNPKQYTIEDSVYFNVPTKNSETTIFQTSKGNGNYEMTQQIITYTFDGWYLDSSYNKKIESITIGSMGNKTLYGKWNKKISTTSGAYIKDNNYVYFGFYPQTDVTKSMGATLSGYVNVLPTNESSSGWTSYKYYLESSNTTDYMWYKDVDVDDNGTFDYRAVYFTCFRPYNTSGNSTINNSYQNENGYTTSKVYWFKYEPIKWRIISESNGKAKLLAEMILDSQDFNNTNISRTIDGQTIYANNYEYSSIRAWLNESFYNTAFSDLQKQIIQTVEVDNSTRSTNTDNNATQWGNGENKYACSNTQDKVWLLSEQEVTRAIYGFSEETGETNTRQKKVTDYSKCQGVFTNTESGYEGNGSWWLRSSRCGYEHCSRVVNSNGSSNLYYGVNSSFIGVVPAIQITL